MPSKDETIEKANHALELHNKGLSVETISRRLKVSKSLVNEYLERNSHPKECSICHGYGISKERSTGKKRPLCDSE